MIYAINPIPATTQKVWVDNALRLRASFVNDAYQDGDVLRWKSNDRCVPPWSFREAFCSARPAQLEAYSLETAEALADYCEAQKDRVLTAEECFEMRSAFGEGAEVVDVITGQTFKL